MADYKNAYSTSLGDYCAVHDIKPSDLEIGVIVAQATERQFTGRNRAFSEAVRKFDEVAAQYEAVVDLQETLVSLRSAGILLILGGLDSTYVIRGTGITHKK